MSFDDRGEGAVTARLIACLDLTSLGDDDDAAGAERLATTGIEAGVAAICLWPRFLPIVQPLLAGSGVKLATVANFPHGDDDILRAVDETEAAYADGADEVDVVIPVEATLAGDIGLVEELVEACVAVRPQGRLLKVILETGVLEDAAVITAAARAAVMAGCDMLKTSTGKVAVGATPEAAATLLEAVAEADGRVGLKLSGGVRTVEQAVGYLRQAEARLGPGWATSSTFRIGASSLLDALRKQH